MSLAHVQIDESAVSLANPFLLQNFFEVTVVRLAPGGVHVLWKKKRSVSCTQARDTTKPAAVAVRRGPLSTRSSYLTIVGLIGS